MSDAKQSLFEVQSKALDILRNGGRQCKLIVGNYMHMMLFDRNGERHEIFHFHAGFPVNDMIITEPTTTS